uniref:hypothetical protein n=1 Tax=Bifidobacterium longum TaxID=216816 RepID=UPI0040280FA5
MTTITITGKQPGKTDVTISSTVNPAVKTVVPVTVKSRNLLSYGPAEGNGLTPPSTLTGRCTSPVPPHGSGRAWRGRSHARYRAP